MNTKPIMAVSAVVLGSAGIVLTFSPDTLVSYLNRGDNDTTLFLLQILGSLYFGFGMLNWMAKTSLIGGIYNRPIAVANFAHFLIAGLALIKGLVSNPNALPIIWIAGAIYLVFGIAFGVLLFQHPIAEKEKVG